MTDELAGLTGETPAPAATPPAAPTVDIEAIAARFQKTMDERISGLQSVNAKQLKALQDSFTKAQRASMSADEQEDQRIADLQAELQQARYEAELARASREYPDESPILERLEAATSPADRLAVLREYRNALTAPPAETVAAAPAQAPSPTAPVDPNRPAPTIQGESMNIGGVDMNSALAAQILRSYDRMPGH